MPVTEPQVLDALRPIVDPDFQKSIVELGFVKNVAIEGGRVRFDIELTTPACPVKAEFEKAARERVLQLDDVTEVDVNMTAQTRGRPAAPEGELLPHVKHTIAVASGKGGVGKSTVSTNLALALHQMGGKVGLLDADVYGPSLPLLMGVSGRPETTEKRILPLEKYGLKLMSMGFFVDEGSPVIWRGPMVHGLITQFLRDVDWGELDYLVIDLPPGTGDAALTLTQSAPLSGAVIVTTANDLSLIDARKGLAMFEKVNVPVLGIVENMSYFTPPELPDKKYYLFGEGGGRRTAEEIGVDFLGELPIDPRVVEGGDIGKPILEFDPDCDVANRLRDVAGSVVRKLAVMASAPPVADANITWVGDPS
ncbi:MAG: Mrp/NBP35 family ATP-binding protein [Deltaproteobacteria bacterium]|nr:Mrp/NBP35 family ATP-binding protein [Deltaproteobacteria bacterium]MBW2444408.1 Mrp/NBP35 family ATP-binding protein [Deltaproteobacteria bacterium]